MRNIDIHSFHDHQFGPDRYTGLQYQVEVMQNAMMEQLGHYKPILLSETDNGKDGGPNPCHLDTNGNSIIRVRTLMASAFTGAAGAGLPWHRNHDEWGEDESARLARYEAYLRLYMQDLDLDGENWKAGRSWRDDQNPTTTTDDHRAAMLYLRRGDGLQATGFIQNLTYNFYTEAKRYYPLDTNNACGNFDADEEWNEFNANANYKEPVYVVAELTGINALKLTGLNGSAMYQTAFYDGFYPVDHPSMPYVGPVPTPTDGSGTFAMPFPELGIPDYPLSEATPCFLFRTERVGNPFKLEDTYTKEFSMQRQQFTSLLVMDTAETVREHVSSNLIDQQVKITVYPNPLIGQQLHVDLSGSSSTAVEIRYEMLDITGKLLGAGVFYNRQNIADMEHYAQGTYNLWLWYSGSMENRLIIKER